MKRAAALAAAALIVASCGSSPAPPRAGAIPPRLAAQSRPIGVAPRFHPPAPRNEPPRCTRHLGPRLAAHIEVFAEDHVVLLPPGIGTGAPRRTLGGRIVAARCYGDVVTLEPTGVVLVRRGMGATLGDVFTAWRQPLTHTRVAGFRGRVRVYVAGRRRPGDLRTTPITEHAEIVVEVGPYVPPHRTFAFPPGRGG